MRVRASKQPVEGQGFSEPHPGLLFGLASDVPLQECADHGDRRPTLIFVLGVRVHMQCLAQVLLVHPLDALLRADDPVVALHADCPLVADGHDAGSNGQDVRLSDRDDREAARQVASDCGQ